MTQLNRSHSFSAFSWALALFCLPSILWPLALLLSPAIADNPTLSKLEITGFSTALWIYPFILLTIAILLKKLHKHTSRIAIIMLIIGFILFYSGLFYLIRNGF